MPRPADDDATLVVGEREVAMGAWGDMQEHEGTVDHLSADTVAAYVRGTLSSSERETAIRHLADCPGCREEALVTARVLRSERARKARRAGGSAIVLAAIALSVSWFATGGLPGSGDPVLREVDGAGAADRSVLEVVSPADTAGPTGLTFAWHAMSGDARYRLSLTRADGTEVWSAGTPDTVLQLPPDVELAPGETYFWWVDALGADGRSVTTGVRTLTVSP